MGAEPRLEESESAGSRVSWAATSVCGSSASASVHTPPGVSFFICDVGLKGPGPASLLDT